MSAARKERSALPLAVLHLLVLGAMASAQFEETDPRFTKDPRDAADPRSVVDPREEGMQPGIETDLDPLEGSDLFEELYSTQNTAALADAFSKSPWEVLGYIHRQAREWLTMVEDNGLATQEGRDAAGALETKMRELAQLADSTLLDSRFEYYVDTLIRWDAEERVAYHEALAQYQQGTAIYDAATTAQQTLPALTPLRQSLATSRQLDDLRGQAACLAIIGRIQSVNGRPAEARSSMREARSIGHSIRDLDAVWDGLTVVMQTSIRLLDFDSAQIALQNQHQLQVVRQHKQLDLQSLYNYLNQ